MAFTKPITPIDAISEASEIIPRPKGDVGEEDADVATTTGAFAEVSSYGIGDGKTFHLANCGVSTTTASHVRCKIVETVVKEGYTTDNGNWVEWFPYGEKFEALGTAEGVSVVVEAKALTGAGVANGYVYGEEE